MPAVNGIEGATEEANIHARLVSAFDRTVGKLNFSWPSVREIGQLQREIGHCPSSHRRMTVWTSSNSAKTTRS
jgi:hypothetical protein